MVLETWWGKPILIGPQGGERYTYSYGAGQVFEVEDGGVHHLQSVSFVEQLSCDD
jgi:hypothetical protein